MKKIESYTIDSNEKANKNQNISLSDAIELYKSFPWESEQVKAKETGCYPTVSFSILPTSSHGEYINIYSYNSDKYSLMIEAFSKKFFLGLIPRWKSVFLDVDSISENKIDELIMQLFTLPQYEFYNWLVNYKKINIENVK